MAMIEIDENQFAASQKLVNTVKQMLGNPKSRTKVLEAYKEIEPNHPIPEIDNKRATDDAVEAVRKELADFRKSEDERRAKEKDENEKNAFVSKFESGRRHLRDDYGVTDEGLKKIEELMTQAGIVDHEIGHAAFTKLYPEPEPLPPAPGLSFQNLLSGETVKNDEFLKAMHASKGQDEGALDRQIHKVLSEVRQSQPVPQHHTGFGRR